MTDRIDQLFRGANRQVARSIIDIIDELEPYHPVTVRQVFYQLIAREIIANSLAGYKKTSGLTTTLRENHLVDWVAMEDRSRRLIDKRGTTDLEQHIKDNARYLFRGYQRCYVQNQENYIEVWTEKDALSGIIEDAVWMYCTRVVICRGNLSSDFLHKYAVRAKAAKRRGQIPVIIYVGDYDPSGLRIPVTIVDKLKKKHGLSGFHLKRAALNRDQISKHDLPASFKAIKKRDPNYKWFLKQGGDVAVELDALHPKDIARIIQDTLNDTLDSEDMVEQRKIEAQDRFTLKKIELGFRKVCREHGLQY